MKVTKSRLKSIIKEEIDKFLQTEQSLAPGKEAAKTLNLAKDPQTLRQFINDNPEAKKYIRGMRTKVRDGYINPEIYKKNRIGSQISSNNITFFPSKQEYLMYKKLQMMMIRPPFSKLNKGGGNTFIGVLFNSSVVSSGTKNYQATSAGKEGTKAINYVSQVMHIISKEYFVPSDVYRRYSEYYQTKGGKQVAGGADALYKYTADVIENITGKKIPGSTNNPVKDKRQLPSKPIYMFSYLMTDSNVAVSRTSNVKGAKKVAPDKTARVDKLN